MGCGLGFAQLTRDHDLVGLNISDDILKSQEPEVGNWVDAQHLKGEPEIAVELAKRGSKTRSPVDLDDSRISPSTHPE